MKLMNLIVSPLRHGESGWFHEKTKYGDFVAFFGTKNFKNIIEKILNNPNAYHLFDSHKMVSIDFDNKNGEEFEYLALRESFRKARNGVQYKWYIKYNWFKDYKSALRFNQWMFSTASLIEHLIIEKIIKIDSIIENIPILKKKYHFVEELDQIRIESKEDQSNSNDAVVEIIKEAKDAFGKILEREIHNVNKDDEKTELIQAIEALKSENSELRIHADNLTNRFKEQISILEQVKNESVEFQKENSTLRKELEMNQSSQEEYFRAVFPNFYFVRKKRFLRDLSKDKNKEDHIKILWKLYEEIFHNQNNIENLNNLEKVKGLDSWYQAFFTKKMSKTRYRSNAIYDHQWQGGVDSKIVEETLKSFYICKVNLHGNTRHYIHFGKSSEEYLQNHDPPQFRLN